MVGHMEEPAKRSPKGSVAHYVKILFRWLNYVVIGGSVGSIACMLLLRLVPTPWGWGFVIFSCLSFFSGFVGCISANHKGCYSLHMFLIITSATVQGIVFLTLFSKSGMVLDHLESSRSDFDAKILLKLNAILLLGVFCTQLAVLVLACVVHHCEPMDYYDLEWKDLRKGRNLARVQEEVIAGDKREESEVSRLNKQKQINNNGQKHNDEKFYSVEI
eukprot:c13885_g1_i2 orf=213-863(+)